MRERGTADGKTGLPVEPTSFTALFPNINVIYFCSPAPSTGGRLVECGFGIDRFFFSSPSRPRSPHLPAHLSFHISFPLARRLCVINVSEWRFPRCDRFLILPFLCAVFGGSLFAFREEKNGFVSPANSGKATRPVRPREAVLMLTCFF